MFGGQSERTQDRGAIFERIYELNAWGEATSRSGPGSSLVETEHLARELPSLLRKLGAGSLLDIPCGDFTWMATVELGEIRYVGADIVETLVREARRWESPSRSFLRLDLTRDDLPRCDVVLVRDCLVHLSSREVLFALANVVRSRAKFLLTTSFTRPHENLDIKTGEWRPLNLELPPFSLPPPLIRLEERPRDERYLDKSLALWELSGLRRALPAVPLGPPWSWRFRMGQLARRMLSLGVTA